MQFYCHQPLTTNHLSLTFYRCFTPDLHQKQKIYLNLTQRFRPIVIYKVVEQKQSNSFINIKIKHYENF